MHYSRNDPPVHSLGAFLRFHRERKDFTIDQVSSSTKINIKIIQALEEDHFEVLPAKPFVRGFVIAICRFLDLDPTAVLVQFEKFIEENFSSFAAPEVASVKTVADQEKKAKRVFFLIVCIIFIGWIVQSNSQKRQEKALLLQELSETDAVGEIPEDPVLANDGSDGEDLPKADTEIETPLVAAVETLVPQEPVPQKVAVAGANAKDPLDSGLDLLPSAIVYKIIVSVLEDVWIRYQVDERPIRKIVVRRGNKLVLRAQKHLQLEVVRPEHISIGYQGKSLAVDSSGIVRLPHSASVVEPLLKEKLPGYVPLPFKP